MCKHYLRCSSFHLKECQKKDMSEDISRIPRQEMVEETAYISSEDMMVGSSTFFLDNHPDLLQGSHLHQGVGDEEEADGGEEAHPVGAGGGGGRPHGFSSVQAGGRCAAPQPPAVRVWQSPGQERLQQGRAEDEAEQDQAGGRLSRGVLHPRLAGDQPHTATHQEPAAQQQACVISWWNSNI